MLGYGLACNSQGNSVTVHCAARSHTRELVFPLITKSILFYENGNFMTVFTAARHWTLF